MLVNFKFYGLFLLMIVSFLFSINELYKLAKLDEKNIDSDIEHFVSKVYLNSFTLYFVLGIVLMKIIENYELIEPFL